MFLLPALGAWITDGLVLYLYFSAARGVGEAPRAGGGGVLCGDEGVGVRARVRGQSAGGPAVLGRGRPAVADGKRGGRAGKLAGEPELLGALEARPRRVRAVVLEGGAVEDLVGGGVVAPADLDWSEHGELPANGGGAP